MIATLKWQLSYFFRGFKMGTLEKRGEKPNFWTDIIIYAEMNVFAFSMIG